MKSAKALFTLCVAMSDATPIVAAPTPGPATADIPRIDYEKYTLPNGLDVILVEDHRLPLVAVNIWYHVGAANEAPGLTGFAHLFEHMMFAATKHVPRGLADQLLEAAGGTDSNGSTAFDRTNYFDTVPSHQLELALWIHADRMGYLLDVLDQTALANQQDVVRNERRQRIENQPYGIVEEGLFHNLFPKTHPYYGRVMGSHADIQAAKLVDIKTFFKTYYRPNNASLAIVGDIDKAKTKKLVAKYFGGFQRGPEVPKVTAVTPPITAERRVVIQDRIELPRVLMGWLTSRVYQPGDAELTLAAQILGGSKSSRLYQKLVYEKQIAQDVNAYQYSLGVASIFGIDVTARPGHTPEEIETAIDEELERLRAAPPDAKELERARNTVETQLVSQLEKIGGSGVADTINQYNHYTGDPGFLVKEVEQYRAADAEAIRSAVQQQLQKSARVVVYGVPGTQDLGPEVPTPPAALAAAGAGTESINADEHWRANPPKAGKQRPLKLPKGESFRLANGLTVIHYYKPGLPLATAQLVVRAGAEANPIDKPGLASFTADLLDEGTAARSSVQIANEVAQLGATLSTNASSDATFVQISALKKNFSAAFDLLADVALHPAFPAEEVERGRASRLGDLVQNRENPSAVASTVTAAVMYGHGHPYGFTDLGTEAAIKSTTRDDLAAFWKRHFLPNNAALIVVGDVTRAEAKALAEARFGDWKSATVPNQEAAPQVKSKARVVLVDKPGAPQTTVRVVGVGPDRKTPDFPALQVMNAGLGGLFTSRINNNLREEKGYTYGAFSGFLYHRQPGVFLVRTNVRTDVTGPAVAEIFKELHGVAGNPYSAEELKRARDSQLLSLPGQFETGAAIASSLASTYVYGLGLDYYARLPAQFRAVTGTQVESAAKKYLRPEEMVVIGVGDVAKISPELEKLKLGPIEYRDADGNEIETAKAAQR
jgi:zinc protease